MRAIRLRRCMAGPRRIRKELDDERCGDKKRFLVGDEVVWMDKGDKATFVETEDCINGFNELERSQ